MAKSFPKMRRKVVEALSSYHMLEAEDHLLVAVSGGLDSSVMLLILKEIQRRAPFRFSLQPVWVDHGFPGLHVEPFVNWVEQLGFTLAIVSCHTYALITQEKRPDHSPCRICSRLRRGALYTFAVKNGFTKIALGHNRDDCNETLLMNMFYSGKLAGMPPKRFTDDGQNTIIRPMCLLSKIEIKDYAANVDFPVVTNPFCENIPDHARYRIRALLAELERGNPSVANNLLASQANLSPSLLMDKKYWDFDASPPASSEKQKKPESQRTK